MSQVAKRPSMGVIEKRVKEGIFILLGAIGIFLMVALVTHSSVNPTTNAAGHIGAWFADMTFYFFGYLAFLLPIIITYSGTFLFKGDDPDSSIPLWLVRAVGYILLIASGCALANMHLPVKASIIPGTAGGLIGKEVQGLLLPEFNSLGTTVLLSAFLFVGMTLSTGISWLSVLKRIGEYALEAIVYIYDTVIYASQVIADGCKGALYNIWDRLQYRLEERAARKLEAAEEEDVEYEYEYVDEDEAEDEEGEGEEEAEAEDDDVEYEYEEYEEEEPEELKSKKVKAGKTKKLPVIQNAFPGVGKKASANKGRKINNQKGSKSSNSKLPAISLLDEPTPFDQSKHYSADALHRLANEVEKKLKDFGIEAKVVSVYPGPVITRFEIDLAAGIKASKVSGLSKDLARSLSVTAVRVVEVIPGKSVVGLEIPNKYRELVLLRDIIESPQYKEAHTPLTLSLGKDISGVPTIADLAKMPHLLVAGTTGSGKSVGVNAMLLSILYKSTPADVRLVLIDPKMLELSIYEGIPHLLTPVVTDMKDAANALRWCVAEMERRYQVMAALGVRNIGGFNNKVEKAAKSGDPLMDPIWESTDGGEPPELEKLPYIVVIIDEFADMIMVVGKKVEELIARIAQKARAAGIHMILATQRPSVDVITGLIKANIPTRIGFQVSSRIDSRTILDQQGAEQLLGHGDMLYLAPGTGLPIRVHGAFVSDNEVHRVVGALKESGSPDYVDNLCQESIYSQFGMDNGYVQEERDELYDKAVFIVTETRKASISYLQRRLKIGYNRAARLIEEMESSGIVTAMQGNGTREVMAPPPIEVE